ncbi:MAG: hypothetical protein ACK5NF_06670 [Bacilli bacterium]
MAFIWLTIALIFKNNSGVQDISLIAMFVIMFLSGTFRDIAESSTHLGKVVRLVPTYYLTTDLYFVWSEKIMLSKELIVCSLSNIVIFGFIALYIANKRLDRPIKFNNLVK